MLLRELRHGLRSLARSPGFALATVLTLGLGIGATTTIFSVVDGVLLRPLGFPQPERLVRLFEVDADGRRMNFSDPNFEDVVAGGDGFSALAQMAPASPVSVSGGAEPFRARLSFVSRGFFPALGVEPVHGRGFVAAEQQSGGPPAVVVSHELWRRTLGGSPDLSSLHLRFEGLDAQVVGVMPPGFDFPAEAELWAPRELLTRLPSRTAHNWQVLGRLREDVSIGQVRQELSALAHRLKAQYGQDTWMADLAVVPLLEQTVGRVRPALLLLLGAGAFLLLIACANAANLLLARLATRQREIAVRRALGANALQLARQLFAESLLLTVPAAALGALLAVWGVAGLQGFGPRDLPRLDEIRVQGAPLGFAFALAVLIGAFLSLAVVLRGRSGDLRGSLALTQRSATAGGASQRLRGALVVAQVALTLVLLTGAALLGRSFVRLAAVDPGYRTQGALVLDLVFSSTGEPDAQARLSHLEDELLDRLGAIPGVEQAGGIGAFGNGTFLVLPGADQAPRPEDFERLMKDPSRTGYCRIPGRQRRLLPRHGHPAPRRPRLRPTRHPRRAPRGVDQRLAGPHPVAGRGPAGQGDRVTAVAAPLPAVYDSPPIGSVGQ